MAGHGDIPWSKANGVVRGFSIREGYGDYASNSNDQSLLPSEAELGVLQLAQSHFASQTLLAVMHLGVLDVLELDGEGPGRSVRDIVMEISDRRGNMEASTINCDALFRCMRLLCTTGVIHEKISAGVGESTFSLTEMGRLLKSPGWSNDDSLSSFIFHWADLPLWNAWSHLPPYIAGNSSGNCSRIMLDDAASDPLDFSVPPFDRANGVSASEYYKNNPGSCSHRNAVARYASSREIASILDAMQNSSFLNDVVLDGKVIVDIGGGYGDLMYAVKRAMPVVGKCYCLDLPGVIDDAMSVMNGCSEQPPLATLVGGNMFDPSTIPPCDLIVTKHVLCDFSDEDVMRALQTFRSALSKGGKVVIMDAVLPNGDDLNGRWNAAVSFDVLLMLSGRRGERSKLDWSNIAEAAGFTLEAVLRTPSVTVDMAILSEA